MIKLLAAAFALLLLTTPAVAETRTYTADLSGGQVTSQTGSAATAHALITVDTAARTVAVSLDVRGLTLDSLWDTLVARPIGPIHLHLYGPHDHATGEQNVSLVFPVPFGPNYAAASDGFSVRMPAMAYADGAALLGSSTSFEDFLTAMDGGRVVLNVHTDNFPEGEISGVVTRTPG